MDCRELLEKSNLLLSENSRLIKEKRSPGFPGERFFFKTTIADPYESELLGGFRLIVAHENLSHFRTRKLGGKIFTGGQHLANLGA